MDKLVAEYFNEKKMKDRIEIIVLVKQVPDIEKIKFDVETGRLDRSSAEAITNPFDLNALETGVQIKEKIGGKVTAISMGPSQTESALRDCLAIGADRAILLTDTKFAGADTLATSYTLASAIGKLGNFDLVVCGEKTIDGDTAQVGSEVAEILGIPHIAYVDEIKNVSKERIEVLSKVEKFYYIHELRFPCLITVTKDVNVPRLPTLKDKLKARRSKVDIWDAEYLADIVGIDKFGMDGSPTNVMKVFTPLATHRKGIIIQGSAEDLAQKPFLILKENGVFR